jgi:sugar porter (SP) family MFS transporter
MKIAKHKGYTVMLISFVAALGGFLQGFQSAAISGALPFYKTDFNLPVGSFLVGLSVSIIGLGAIIGNLMAGPIADKFGRKKSLIFAAFLYALCAIGAAIAHDIVLFIIARAIGGIAIGVSILVIPMYIAEIAPSEKRGFLVSFNQFLIVTGIFLAFFSNKVIVGLIDDPDVVWRWMLGVAFLPSVLYFIFVFFIPESPRWLTRQDEHEKSKDILKKTIGEHNLEVEYNKILISLEEAKKQKKATFAEVFSKSMKLVLLIGFGLAFFQQITGINAVLFYAPMIFNLTGGVTSASISHAVYLGVINLVFTLLAMGYIDRFGRKPLLVIGATGITISLFLAGIAFNNATYTISDKSLEYIRAEIHEMPAVQNGSEQIIQGLAALKGETYTSEVMFFDHVEQQIGSENYDLLKQPVLRNTISMNSMLVLISILVFIACFAFSMGPVMWVLFSEIFPNRLRGLAISVVGAFGGIISTLVMLVFPVELEKLGAATTFFIFAALGLASVIFIISIIPETKKKSLEELEKILIK